MGVDGGVSSLERSRVEWTWKDEDSGKGRQGSTGKVISDGTAGAKVERDKRLAGGMDLSKSQTGLGCMLTDTIQINVSHSCGEAAGWSSTWDAPDLSGVCLCVESQASICSEEAPLPHSI